MRTYYFNKTDQCVTLLEDTMVFQVQALNARETLVWPDPRRSHSLCGHVYYGELNDHFPPLGFRNYEQYLWANVLGMYGS